MAYIEQFEDIRCLLQRADYTDVKVVEGRVSLREFIASMLSYYPRWVIGLYRIRAVFVRLLGMRQEYIDMLPALKPEDVPFEPGKSATFFILRQAKADEYWIAETPEEKHLSAFLAVVAEPLGENRQRFHVMTIVNYKHWTGPVYFNTIRPFHHLVVSRMAQAGVSSRKN